MPTSIGRGLTAALALAASACVARADDDLDAVAMLTVHGTDAHGARVARHGSAFLVGGRGQALTSYHLVEPPEAGWGVDEFGGRDAHLSVLLRSRETGFLTDARPASVRASDAGADAAVLDVTGSPRPGLSTCPGAAASTGDVLLVVGAEPGTAGQPPRLDPRSGAAGEPQASDAPFVRVSVASQEGFSGGPVFKTAANGKRELVGLLKGGDPLNDRVHSLVVPLGAMRGKVVAACDVACSHPDHGVDHYASSREGDLHVSDWQRGGSDPTKYCDAYAAAERREAPDRIVTVVHAVDHDDRKFTGMRGGMPIVAEAQYRYECRLLYQAGPVYKVKVSPSCPAPPNPLELPR